jgi:hypothetical protein
MKKLLILTSLLISGSLWAGETDDQVEYEMLPLQPPSANPLETAKGLMRCLQLYTTIIAHKDLACGLHDWKNKNKGGREEFIKSKQFKTCGDYEAYKLRDEYAFKFMQIAYLIAHEEGIAKELLYLHNDEQSDAYHELNQELINLGNKLKSLSDDEELQELNKIPFFTDLSICMDYRDYVDSIYKK